MAVSLRGVTLRVDDLKAALRFYQDVLQATMVFQDRNQFAILEIDGIRINLLAGAEADTGGPMALSVRVETSGGNPMALLKKALSAAVAAGGSVTKVPRRGGHEVRAEIADTSGNRLLFYGSLPGQS